MKANKSLLKRWIPILVVLVVLVAAAAVVSRVVAYYIRSTDEVEEDYTPAEAKDPSFELGSGTTEVTNVVISVPDEGYPVYVRAAIVVTWKLENGDVFFGDFGAPPPNDYTLLTGDQWQLQSDGFYYYKAALESGKTTAPLVTRCALGTQDVPDGCVLSVEIIVQTIQAIGTTDGSNEIPAWNDAGWQGVNWPSN